MKCRNCGAENQEGSSYCSNCGYPFKQQIIDESVENLVKEWYYYNGQETIGPLSESDIYKENLKDNYLVWTQGMEDWVSYMSSDIYKHKKRQQVSSTGDRILPIIIYIALSIIAILCFFPVYKTIEFGGLVSNSAEYKMLDDIALIVIPCLAIIATTIAAKKYFASFWVSLILGIIMYVKLIFIPSVDFGLDYNLLNYGVVLYGAIFTYVVLFVSVSILFAKSQKNSVKMRYEK